MKKSLLFLVTLLATAACVHNDSRTVTPVTAPEDPDWIKLEIPTGQEAYAIAGDIDKTLLVTTLIKAYYTTDRGKTWQESKNFNGPVPGLLVRNDTTFAMMGRVSDPQGNLLGSGLVQYFTADYGKTWEDYFKYYKSYIHDIKPIGTVKSASGVVYSIKANSTPVTPGSPSSYINPSEITKTDAFGQQTVRFPFKHNLINLHLDIQDRLYVAASGGTYQSESNTFLCCSDKMAAVVYISKHSLP